MKFNSVPRHVAIIMDGNGRWAKKRLLPRSFGHKEGVKTIDKIATYCFDIGIEYLTLYAFSTENWNRPQDEVQGLLELLKKYLKTEVVKLERRGVRLRIFGDVSVLDEETRTLLDDAYARTEKCNNGSLNICFNYGGRAELTMAVNRLIEKGKPITEKDLSESLYTVGVPDPDVIIRTGGEHRISNFLLYQMAYSEIYFVPTLWPDFSEKDIDEIVTDYNSTDRRFGKI